MRDRLIDSFRLAQAFMKQVDWDVPDDFDVTDAVKLLALREGEESIAYARDLMKGLPKFLRERCTVVLRVEPVRPKP